MDLKDN